MQNYRIDFAMNRGHEMLLDRESGIDRSELDDIELNMLRGQRIPYLLPVDWFELDGKVTFRYTLSGLKMLLHRLQQQPLTMQQYYMLILGVTDALNECKHYMLRPDGCLLDEQFIFIGEQLHDIKLAYVPMIAHSGEQSIGAGDLLSLVVRFTTYVDRIDGEGLKRVLLHLKGKKWPLMELRSTLLELINGAQMPLIHEELVESEQISRHDNVINSELLRMQPHPIDPQHVDEKLVDQAFANPKFEDLPFHDEQELVEQDGRKKWILTSVLVIAAACVWRFGYLAEPSRQSLLISSGLTLLLAAVSLFVWRKNATRLVSSVEAQFEMEQFVPDSGPLAKLERWQKEQEKNDDYSIHTLYERSASASSAAVVAAQPLASASIEHSVLGQRLPSADPTVLMGRETQQKPISEPFIWLKRSWEGQEEKIDLNEPCLKIGRAGEQAGYTEQANGVSRLHLEIEAVNGEYRAKDLGSRNGSLLNGKTMIPYKAYKLSVGDVIQLAGEKGPSYELKAG